jgi:hypothetical protein
VLNLLPLCAVLELQTVRTTGRPPAPGQLHLPANQYLDALGGGGGVAAPAPAPGESPWGACREEGVCIEGGGEAPGRLGTSACHLMCTVCQVPIPLI